MSWIVCASVVAKQAGLARQGAQRLRRIARELVHAMRADRHAKVLRDDVLQLVRFVDDGQIALRNDLAEAALPHRRVGAEQVMVDDHDARVGGARLSCA